jgi:hypothetical protein
MSIQFSVGSSLKHGLFILLGKYFAYIGFFVPHGQFFFVGGGEQSIFEAHVAAVVRYFLF